MPIFWAVFLTVAMGLLVPGMPLALAAEGEGPIAVVLAIVTGVPWLYLVVRAAMMRVVVSDRGLLVAGYLRSTFVPWEDVERLMTTMGSGGMQTGNGRVELAIVRKGQPGWLLATATSTATEDVQQLARRLGPVEVVARERGVPFEWKGLDEATQAQIRSITAPID